MSHGFSRSMSGLPRFDYDSQWQEQERRERRRRWFVMFASAVGVAAIAKGCALYVQRGTAVMEADPPRVVVDKSHAIESHSFACGRNCVRTSNDDVWTLLAADGGTCRVSSAEYARAQVGRAWKCAELFGWSE